MHIVTTIALGGLSVSSLDKFFGKYPNIIVNNLRFKNITLLEILNFYFPTNFLHGLLEQPYIYTTSTSRMIYSIIKDPGHIALFYGQIALFKPANFGPLLLTAFFLAIRSVP